MILDGVKFERAQSLDQACARVAALVKNNEPFHVLAGGTDLVVESHLAPHTERPGRLILDVSSLKRLACSWCALVLIRGVSRPFFLPSGTGDLGR